MTSRLSSGRSVFSQITMVRGLMGTLSRDFVQGYNRDWDHAE
ncbi:MAG: hypothetical protein ABJE95_30530 [Byssovorax sp.]